MAFLQLAAAAALNGSFNDGVEELASNAFDILSRITQTPKFGLIESSQTGDTLDGKQIGKGTDTQHAQIWYSKSFSGWRHRQ